MLQTQAPRILHVSVSQPPSRFMAKSLQDAGYRYIPLEQNAGVEEALLIHKPDLVLLDLDRFDATLLRIWPDQLLKRHRSIPIVALVAAKPENSPIEYADEVCALHWGIDVYLRKPVSSQRLMARIRVLLRRSTDAFIPNQT